MATPDSSPSRTEPETDLDANDNSSRGLVPVTARPPVVCFVSCAGNAAFGAVIGSVIGYGSGLWNKQGFRGSLVSAGSSAKSFGVLSGMHVLIVCLLKWIRRRDDAINPGIAGCCAGLVVGFPAAPASLLKSCLTFGAFTYIAEGLNARQASAHSYSMKNRSTKNTFRYNGPPTLALPLAEELKGAFEAFCKSLKKPKSIFPTAQ